MNSNGKLTTALQGLFNNMQSSSSSFYTSLSHFLYPIHTIPEPKGRNLNKSEYDMIKYNKWFSTDQGMSKLIIVV